MTQSQNKQTTDSSSDSSLKEKKEQQILDNRLSAIKHKVLVLSGKGGVGKSTVAAQIAFGLAQKGKRVGLLDIDIHGPSIPKILGLEGQKINVTEGGMLPIKYQENISVMSIGFLVPDEDEAIIWRGPMKYGVIKQFLTEVVWDELDYLIVDSPPGTGDEPLSIAQFLSPDANAVVVTTPQELAIADVRRSVKFCQKLNINILGVVENMSGFVCPHCSKTVDIFKAGGGKEMAESMNIPFLGKIPLDPELVEAGDSGKIYLKSHEDSESGQSIQKIIEPVLAMDSDSDSEPTETTNETAKPAPNLIRIAVPTANGKLCAHFGHCQTFAIIDANPIDGKIISSKNIDPPQHEPGVLPQWLADIGAHMIIAGGMGSRAQNLFTSHGLKVIVGAAVASPAELVAAYFRDDLETGQNICDH